VVSLAVFPPLWSVTMRVLLIILQLVRGKP